MTAEAGRALVSFRKSVSGDRRAAEIKDVIEQFGGRGKIEDIAERMAALDTDESIARFSRAIVKPTLKDKVFEVWINSLLSGPKTQAVNFLSNSLVTLWVVPEKVIASGISAARLAPKEDKAFFSEAAGEAVGIVEGIVEGTAAGVRAFRTERTTDPFTRLEVAREPAIGGKVGRVVRIPGRALQATDEFFKAIGSRQSINASAIRHARAEGLSGRAAAERIDELRRNPTDEMLEAAANRAREQTFTKPLGPLGASVTKVLDSTPGGRIIVPFIRTPTNIIKFAGERSPFAPLMKDVRKNLKAGGAARDEQLARMVMGSAVSTTAAYYAAQGVITGGGPTDPNERRVWLQDHQPYSIKIGDTWHAYGRLEPLGILLGAAADFADGRDRMNDEDAEDLATLIAASATKNLISKSWLRGVSEMVNALEDPDRYGERFVQNLAGTLVPTGVAQVSDAMDPTWREVYSINDKIRSRVPGMTDALFPRRDVWGEPIKSEGGVGPDILSPIKKKSARVDPVNKKLLDLKVFPSKLKKEISGVELTPVQYDDYQTAAGRLSKAVLDQVVAQPQFDRLPVFKQEEMVRKIISKSRSTARKEVIQRYPEIGLQAVEQKIKEISR